MTRHYYHENEAVLRQATARNSSDISTSRGVQIGRAFVYVAVQVGRQTAKKCSFKRFSGTPPCMRRKNMLQCSQHTRRTACLLCAGNVHQGRVSFYADSSEIIYPKGWLDYEGQVEKLRKRGLEIADAEVAKQFLAYSNYYRFTGFRFRFLGFRGSPAKSGRCSRPYT